ncbi:ATP-dependent Clp protease ATP-binding subunit [Gehongia tenuis]|uniref:ATP-dependent Clp protease ATP-binding subunit n=1 Tax=Gehongia tenuis TaxID=2763655 RepID=A0A926D3R9_9FIRM|nr:ATP-dependent Clp protease ATP-binding subunit [Gehongia tenuis]MBC8531218.1 ATP-dependent Clp protease ATP-binding subunit [Gehongia tenuis]
MAYYGRFTERAQKVLVHAQEAAKGLGHNYVGTEHLLLGLLQDDGGSAVKVLRSMGVTYEGVERIVLTLIGKGDYKFTENFGYTPRTKKVMELSVREARDMGHSYVGTEHILMALVREKDGVAARIIAQLGADLDQIQRLIMKSFQEESTDGRLKTTQKKTPALDQFGRDLTQAAKDGELDPVIGRTKEIERIIQILSRRTKNNPVLIGEPGVGKTAVAEGLAQRIVEGSVTELLRNKRVVSLDLSGMLAGAKFRGDFEERMKNALKDIKNAGNIILFIDEIHTLIGAGAAEGAIDAANILKPALARGELQAIGATTLDEYRKHIEKDAALERRFQPVMVGEPTLEESVAILEGLRDRYEAHHKVTITDEAIRAAVQLSDRYISDRFLPDKAIDLIDEAASKVRIQSLTAPPDMKEIEGRLEAVRKEKVEAVNNQDYEKAAKMRDEEATIKLEMDKHIEAWKASRDTKKLTVGEKEIADVVSSWTNIPVMQLTQDEAERLLHLEKTLHARVIGQDEAVAAVAKAIRRARAGLKDPKRPIGSFIFLGPTGVGKTELSRALAEALFGDEDAMIRLDMSEYMERHSVSRLMGSPPGYVGYEEGGQLTEQVRRKPYSVVLLDEVEKAHPDVFNTLLQIMEDGRLTDGQGRTVDFRNTVLIMTSNVGAHSMKQRALGFAASESDVQTYERLKENVMEELRRTFRPEFLNRVDETIVFHQLNEADTRKIVTLMMDSVAKRLAEREIYLTMSEPALDYLAKEGFDPEYGARPLRRAIQRMVEDRLSEEILDGSIHIGDHVVGSIRKGKLVFTKQHDEATQPAE